MPVYSIIRPNMGVEGVMELFHDLISSPLFGM